MRFSIVGTKEENVIERGIRANIYTLGSQYKLHGMRVAPVNVKEPGNNRVEIVAFSDETTLQRFYDDTVNWVRENVGPTVKVTPLEDYKGLEPDWREFREDFNTEQLAKGINYLEKFGGPLLKTLQEINHKLGKDK